MTKAHNLKKYTLIGAIVFFILVISIFVYIVAPRGKPVIALKQEAFLEILKDGDIICRLGDRLWSQLFKDVSFEDKRYSHVGIIRIIDKQITVIHSEGTTTLRQDIVKEEALDDFIKIARAFGIYRMKSIDGNLLSDVAIEYLGIPFDWHFDLEDESKLYCTELLHVMLKRLTPALKLNTIYIKELEREIIPLDSVSNSDYFFEIYYSGG